MRLNRIIRTYAKKVDIGKKLFVLDSQVLGKSRPAIVSVDSITNSCLSDEIFHVIEIKRLINKYFNIGVVVDIGCARGAWVRWLATIEKVQKVYGVEINADLIAMMNSNNFNKKIGYLRGDLDSQIFQLPENELILLSGVLQCIYNLDQALNNIRNSMSNFTIIARLPVFMHHKSIMVYQDGVIEIYIRNYYELIKKIKASFTIVECVVSSEIMYVDNIIEPIFNIHIVLQK